MAAAITPPRRPSSEDNLWVSEVWPFTEEEESRIHSKRHFATGHSNANSILNGGGPSGSIKYGTLIPNRVFVGGISNTTTEADLHKLFSEYGNVRATKIISDRGGASKGYGFVTFETEEEAKKLQDEVSGRSES